MQKKEIAVYVALLGSTILWGCSYVWTKNALNYFPPFTLVFLRLLISSLLLASLGILTKQLQSIDFQQFKSLFLLCFFEPFLYFIGESKGLTYVSATTAAIIVSLIPLVSPFVAWYFFKEKFFISNFIGILISICGVSLVILKDNFTLSASPIGILFMLLAVSTAILYSVMLVKITKVLNVYSIITYQSIFGTIMFLPMVVGFESIHFTTLTFTLKTLTPIVLLAVFASSLAFMLYGVGVKHMGMARTSVFTNLIPVFTAITSFFILGERLAWQNMVGILLAMVGLFTAQLMKDKKKF